MKIEEVLRHPRPSISFEFFPPKTEPGVEHLMATIKALRILNPAFVSVTYGAGGSTRSRTLELARRIKHELEIEPMAHVTCTDHSRAELTTIFDELRAGGIENIMALRGDPPRDSGRFQSHPSGFGYAHELIAMLNERYDFSIGAAAYPEKHPEAASFDSDIENAARKVRAGANFLVTQFFFENDAYFSYVERLRAAGIEVPVIPGIMPITSYDAIARMLAMNGGTMPQSLLAELEARRDEPEAIADLGVAFTSLQCRELLQRGAPGLHFYTLNKSPAARAIVSALIATKSLREVAVAR